MSLPMSNSPSSFGGITTEVSDGIESGTDSGGQHSFNNMSLLSPLRKMDFALCKKIIFKIILVKNIFLFQLNIIKL